LLRGPIRDRQGGEAAPSGPMPCSRERNVNGSQRKLT
jgi:hypothetical protein